MFLYDKLGKMMQAVMRLVVCFLMASAGLTVAWANHVVYKSVGKFGETRYTQQLPDGPSEAIPLRLAASQPAPQHQAHCQTLKNSLATLLSGGTIHEIDQAGNKTLLNAEQVASRITQIRQTLDQHCRG